MISFVRKNYRFFICFFALLALLMSVLRIFVIKNNMETLMFENTKQYRVEKNPVTNAFSVAVIVLIAIFFIFGMLCEKQRSMKNDKPYAFFTSALTGFIMLSSAAYLIAEKLFFKSESNTAFLIMCVFMILSSVHFVMSPSFMAKGKKNVALFLSLMPILTVIIKLVTTFVETTDFQTLSSYPFLISSLSFLLLYFVNEGRHFSSTQMTKVYVFFGLSTILLLSVYSVPDLVLRLFWDLDLNEQTVFSTIGVVLSLYIFTRLLSLDTIANENDESKKKI